MSRLPSVAQIIRAEIDGRDPATSRTLRPPGADAVTDEDDDVVLSAPHAASTTIAKSALSNRDDALIRVTSSHRTVRGTKSRERARVTHEQVAQLLGAYALHALDAADEAAVRGHLATCGACRREVASYEHVASLLALLDSDDSP